MPVPSRVIYTALNVLEFKRPLITRQLPQVARSASTMAKTNSRKRARTDDSDKGTSTEQRHENKDDGEVAGSIPAVETEPSKDHTGAHDTTRTHREELAACSTEEGAWRTQPPYASSASNSSAQLTHHHEAQCHCGHIRYWLSRAAPLATKLCHCRDCQSLHGAPLQWAAIFHKEDMHFENGSKGLAFYNSSKKHTVHELPAKVSCAYCHAPIMDEGRNMVLIFPSLIRFRDEESRRGFEPQMHIFYEKRVVDIPDGKPKWRGMDEKSELMEDVD